MSRTNGKMRNGTTAATRLRLPGPPFKRRLLHGLQSCLQRSGVADAYVRARELRGAVVLMYHSVAAAEEARWIDPRNHLTPAVFAKHVAFLARHRRVISLATLHDELERGIDPPAGTVVITFDDGYRDNWTVAAPLLRDAGLPATLFLATGYVERGENQWIDQLYAAFTTRTRAELDLGDGRRFELRRPSQVQRAYAAVAGALLTAQPQRRAQMLHALQRELQPAGTPPRLTLDWEETRHFRDEHPQFSFGLHTREHVDLTHCDEAVVQAELAACRCDAQEQLGDSPKYFSYPYNRSQAATRRLVEQAGFRVAFAREAAEVIVSGADPLALPRVPAPASLARLAFITGGAYPRLSQAVLGRA